MNVDHRISNMDSWDYLLDNFKSRNLHGQKLQRFLHFFANFRKQLQKVFAFKNVEVFSRHSHETGRRDLCYKRILNIITII